MKPLRIALGRFDATIAYEKDRTLDGNGFTSRPIKGTVEAVLEIDVDELARKLVGRAALTKRGRSALAGGAIVVKTVRR